MPPGKRSLLKQLLPKNTQYIEDHEQVHRNVSCPG